MVLGPRSIGKKVKTTESIMQLREQMYNIFDKLSSNDLWCLLKILIKLDLTGFVMSYCLEILEDRGELPLGFDAKIASRRSGAADS